MSMRSGAAGWRGREALELTNGVVCATVLPKGGHLAEWRFANGHGSTQENALWEAPWTTLDPGTPAYRQFVQEAGDAGSGRFLASFTGHALCLDGFGPVSDAEIANGAGLHGEASIAEWAFTCEGARSATGTATLPLARLSVTRAFSLLAGESVIRVDEWVTNLAERGRNLHWVQHATIGQPMFTGKTARVAASVQKGVTWPLGYDGENLLERDTPFVWPWAPRANGEAADLRELFVQRGSGFVAAAQQTPGRGQGFVAAWDAERRLAMGYVFAAAVFPWVTFWEENRARREFPWNGAVLARGLEFGTTPLPLGNEAVDARGPVLGVPASLRLEARETRRAPWLLFLAELPSGCDELRDVKTGEDEIVLEFKTRTIHLAAAGAGEFLQSDPGKEKVKAA